MRPVRLVQSDASNFAGGLLDSDLPPYTFPYRANFDKNGELWASTMHTDRVVRLDPKNGGAVENLMPYDTNNSTGIIDNSKTPVTFWVGSNHDSTMVKSEPHHSSLGGE